MTGGSGEALRSAAQPRDDDGSAVAVLAFGANQGDREAAIRQAQRALAEASGIIDVLVSPLRETIALRPHGPDPDAPRYLNGVAEVRTVLEPHRLLDLAQRIELEHGRVRAAPWGDRTLDIDIIAYADRRIETDRLTVPHPLAHERDFVLAPWAELDPSAVLPGRGPVAALLASLGDTTLPYRGDDRARG